LRPDGADQRLEPFPVVARHRDPQRLARPLSGQERVQGPQTPFLPRPTPTTEAIPVHDAPPPARPSLRPAGAPAPAGTRVKIRHAYVCVNTVFAGVASGHLAARGADE